MSKECSACGRADEGHYIGCAEAAEPDPFASAIARGFKDLGVTCAFGECANPKRPKGKGPAPKYCTDHSDPKNRK